jgi:hypothetical protein
MMMSRRLSTLLVLAVSVTAVAAQDAAVNACPPVKSIVNKGYHDEAMCDGQYFNAYKKNVQRDRMYQSLKQNGEAARVPNEKTVTCPGADAVNLMESGARQGYDTTWIVENTASVAVVLCWVDPDTNMEYSAIDSSIAPPVNDPRAILKPGEWKAVWTYEGHVFYARELDPETGQAGRIVLQHRTGLYPVGEGVTGLSCPEPDVEPVEEETGILLDEYARTDWPADMPRRCNEIDIGFRNAANCPLHGYWIPHPLDAPVDPVTSCPMEEFKLHLGLESITNDFHWDWKSQTKFEGSAIGHSFAFRSASDPSILVETVTLAPTKVIDCPLREATSEMEITADRVMLPVRFRHHHPTNATDETLLEYYANATLQDQEYERVSVSGSRYGATSASSF